MNYITIRDIIQNYHNCCDLGVLWDWKHFICSPKIWNILPDSLRKINRLGVFKFAIKSWKPEKCPCRFCRVFTMLVLYQKAWILSNRQMTRLRVTFILYFSVKADVDIWIIFLIIICIIVNTSNKAWLFLVSVCLSVNLLNRVKNK